jgi:hypothetical protein
MIFTPPYSISNRSSRKSIFLGGSIEMGKAIDWQTNWAMRYSGEGFNVFNPRRLDWDSSWEQSIETPQFFQQVTWELQALDTADIIILYFQPGTQSPISLLELGLYASSGKLLVCCPEGFWRRGNVDIVCNRYNIKQFESLEAIYTHIDSTKRN